METPAARTRTLANGMRLVLIENHDAPAFASVVTVEAGAVHERPEEAGSAHMLEHFLFNGTRSRSREEIERQTESNGIYSNAHTDIETTSFQMLVHRDRATVALALQADMLFRSTLPAELMEKEKGIVLNEIARGAPPNGPAARVRAALLDGTPYDRDPLGTPTSVGALTRDALWAFYRARYVPGAMTAVLMGDLSAEVMERLAAEAFGGEPARPMTKAPGFAIDARPLGRVLPATESAGPARVAATAPAPTWGEPGHAASRVLADRLPGWLERGLASASSSPARVQADLQSWRDVALLELVVEQDGVTAPTLLARVQDALARLALEETDPEDLDRARTRLGAGEVYLAEKPHYFGMLNGPWIALAGWGSYAEFAAELEALRPEQLRRQLGQILSSRRAVWASEGPAGSASERPAASASAPARVDHAGAATGARRVDRQPPGGPRVIVTSSVSSRVFAAHVLVRGRQALEPEGRAGIVELVHRSLALGVEGGDRAALDDALARQGAQIKVGDDPSIPYDDHYTARDFSFVRFETLDAAALDRGIPLLASLLTRPTLDSLAVAAERDAATRRAEAARQSPLERARALLASALFGADSPFSQPLAGTPESLAAVTPDEVRSFAHRLLSPERLLITVMTSLDPDLVADRLLTALGRRDTGATPAPASAAPPAWMSRVGTPPAAEARSVRSHLGKPQAVVLRGRLLRLEGAALPAARTAVALLSDGMAEEIRERQGMSYGLDATLTPIGEPPAAWMLEIRVGTRPDQVEAVRVALDQLLAAARTVPPAPDDLVRIWNRAAGQDLMRRLARINRAYRDGWALFHGLDPEEVMGEGDAWRRLTPAAIQQAARELFATEFLMEAVVD